MGTSGRMIERHYGTLISGAQHSIRARLEAGAAARRRAAENAEEAGE